MKPIMAERGRSSGRAEALGSGPLRSGFTLIEVLFASTISLLLFLTLLETLSVCQRMASNIKWRLAADAVAYDTAWRVFNQQTAWFDAYNLNTSPWATVPADATSVWYGGKPAYVWCSVKPVDVPTTKWVITTNVKWPLPGDRSAELPRDYVIERCRSDRNLFRGMN